MSGFLEALLLLLTTTVISGKIFNSPLLNLKKDLYTAQCKKYEIKLDMSTLYDSSRYLTAEQALRPKIIQSL